MLILQTENKSFWKTELGFIFLWEKVIGEMKTLYTPPQKKVRNSGMTNSTVDSM